MGSIMQHAKICDEPRCFEYAQIFESFCEAHLEAQKISEVQKKKRQSNEKEKEAVQKWLKSP